MSLERQDILNQIEELEQRKEELENNENEEEYDNYLDDCQGDINIGSLTYSASQVLKAVDEIAYNCGHSEYNDNLISDIEDELEDLREELNELDIVEAEQVE